MSQQRLLLVEDDRSLAEWILDYLSSHGFVVTLAETGAQAIEHFKTDAFDLMVLDLNLPDMSGFQVAQMVFKVRPFPVLMLTASDDDEDEIKGLGLGIADFMRKPVRPKVLLAHIEALLRFWGERNSQQSELNFAALKLVKNSKSCFVNSTSVSLTTHEFDLLWLLASQAGEIVSREHLLRDLRGIDYDGFDRSVDISISRLRKKLNQSYPSTQEKIKTVRAKGYLFVTQAWQE